MSQTDPIPSSPPLDSVLVAGAVLLVGAATAWGGWQLEYWTDLGPGPGFFPFWLGLLLGLLGAIWLVNDLRARRGTRTTTGPEPASATRALSGEVHPDGATDALGPAAPEQAYSVRTSAAIVVSLLVLAACLEVIGYQLSMLAFLFFHLFVLGKRGLLLSLAISVAGSFGVFVVFTRLLTVALPTASIPFLTQLGL